MPDDKMSKSWLQPQKKKKKKKKQEVKSTSPKDADHLHPASSAPLPSLTMDPPPRPPLPSLRPSPQKKDSGGRRSRKSQVSLLGLVCRSGGSPVQSFLSQLSVQARESVRWEGTLDDPGDEEQRLELYRDNRRLRYVRHRETENKEGS